MILLALQLRTSHHHRARLAEAEAELNRERLARTALQAQIQAGHETPAALRCRELESQVTIIVQRYEAREQELRAQMQRSHRGLELELVRDAQLCSHRLPLLRGTDHLARQGCRGVC